MASIAHLGLGLMVASVDVTGGRASGPVDVRRAVRRVTSRAIRVRFDRVERRKLRPLVARYARGRGRDPARAVRAVTGRAPTFDMFVLAALFMGVARGARGGASALTRVGLVAPDAGLVAGRRGRLLGGVTGPTRRRRLFTVDVAAVARRAVAMARVGCGELDLGRVAGRADRGSRGRREVVRTMALGAFGPGVGRGV